LLTPRMDDFLHYGGIKMRVLVLLLAILVLSYPAWGLSLGCQNELVNGDFSEGLYGWAVIGTEPEVCGSGGPLPDPPTGDNYACWYSEDGPIEGAIEQYIYTEPGPYIIDICGFVFLYYTDSGNVTLEVTLTADDNPIHTEQFTTSSWDWWYFEYITPEPVWVEEYKDIHISIYAEDGCIYGGVALLDVEEILIPEPATLSLLIFGAGLIPAFIKRL